MAAIQCQKQTNNHMESAMVYEKKTTEACCKTNNDEHTFANKMKGLFHHGNNDHQAHVAMNKHERCQQHQPGNHVAVNKHEGRQQHQSGNHVSVNKHDGCQQHPSATCISSNNTHAQGKKKHGAVTCAGKKKEEEKHAAVNCIGRKEEGKHGGGFFANIEEQVKRVTYKVESKRKSKGKRSNGDDGSSSSSSDESDNDCYEKKK